MTSNNFQGHGFKSQILEMVIYGMYFCNDFFLQHSCKKYSSIQKVSIWRENIYISKE
jgi:hypothetical protein